MQVEGKGNIIKHGANIILKGSCRGDNNRIVVGSAKLESELVIDINGNNNVIEVGQPNRIKKMHVRVGNRLPAKYTRLTIGGEFSTESNVKIIMPSSGNSVHIGNECMFSNNIVIRCGEAPHLIFDLVTGEYLDVTDGVSIGNHVWVGEQVYITKRAGIADDSIVAACSVVTKKFTKNNTVLGGNPARIVREGVQWIRNERLLEPGSVFHRGWLDYQATLDD